MPRRSLLPATVLLAAAASLPACTTKFTAATDAHCAGDFPGAAKQADALCPTVVKDGAVDGVKVTYDRDAMWIGLEKSMILLDAGRVEDAVRLLSHVDSEAAFLRSVESAYLDNPVDPANWDAGQFAQDAGQAVLGADQTTFLLQPHEMILARSYVALGKLLARMPAAEGDAREAQRYQDLVTADMRIAGERMAQPPVSRMDGVIRGTLPSGQTTPFTVASVFTLGDFAGAKERMKAAIDAARAVRAADPRAAFACAVAWASYVRSGQLTEALNAARALGDYSGASEAATAMSEFTSNRDSDFVLVLVDAGRAPARKSFDVRVPIVIPKVGSTVFRAVYPELRFRPEDRPTAISVTADGAQTPVKAMSSIDAMAALNFQRREPELWWVPTIRAAIRSTAAIIAQAAQDKDSNAAKLLIAIGSVVVAEAEQPDLRMWTTLPATQHVAVVRRPADGRVTVGLRCEAGTMGSVAVSVPEGPSVVFVRAFTPQLHAAQVGSLVPISPADPSARQAAR